MQKHQWLYCSEMKSQLSYHLNRIIDHSRIDEYNSNEIWAQINKVGQPNSWT